MSKNFITSELKFRLENIFGNNSNPSSWHIGVLKLNSATKAFFNSANVVKKKFLTRLQHTRQQERNQVENLVILILLIYIGINASLVSFVGILAYQEQESLYKESISAFPVPCEDLSLSADEDFFTFDIQTSDLRTFIDNKGKYICSKSSVAETIKTIVERKSRLRLAKGLEEQYMSCGNESLAEKSGHLTVAFTEISKHQNDSGEGSDVKLHWNEDQDKCHIDPSVHYDNGEVTILEGRTYYVYASAHFNISRPEGNGIQNFRRQHRFSIRICKNVYGYEQTLLGRIESFDMTNTETAVSSLSIGCHLELSRNDKIYVRVNDANKIVHDSRGNNFGLFPL